MSVPICTHLFTKRTHRDLGGRVTGVVSRAGSAPNGQILSSAGYLLDAKGRRQALTREDGTRWEFGYNSRDEVESGVKKQSNGNLLAGRQFSYQYDDVGNRETARFGGDGNGGNLRTIGYTADEVNQYTAIAHPGVAQVLGYSPDAGAITVTPGQAGNTTVQGKFWRAEIGVGNDPTGIWADVEAEQVVSGTPATIGQGKLWIPPATTVPVHDDDGNLKQDGRWNYKWNGENRLVEMTTAANALTGGHPWMRLSFQYDFMGRRIHKKVETGNPTTPVVTVNRLFIYDGWNLLAEVETASGNAKLAATYLWGRDLSGTMQGAGGVGGLLLARQDINGDAIVDAEFRPAYDGNGNIIAWIGGTGSVVSRIDYDPFGRVLTRQGSVDRLAYGFSTKYQDVETGLLYYGYRFYDPDTGRWISRDPIEEDGGVNLYGFVGNSGSGNVDKLGLDIMLNVQWQFQENGRGGNGSFLAVFANNLTRINIIPDGYSGTTSMPFWNDRVNMEPDKKANHRDTEVLNKFVESDIAFNSAMSKADEGNRIDSLLLSGTERGCPFELHIKFKEEEDEEINHANEERFQKGEFFGPYKFRLKIIVDKEKSWYTENSKPALIATQDYHVADRRAVEHAYLMVPVPGPVAYEATVKPAPPPPESHWKNFTSYTTVCVEAATFVQTPGGLTAIEKVKAGNFVLGYSRETNGWGFQKILDVYINKSIQGLAQIEVGGEVISLTLWHPVMVVSDSASGPFCKWKRASEVRDGDLLYTSSGLAEVTRVSILKPDNVSTVNLLVDKSHNFAIGVRGYLVGDVEVCRQSAPGLEFQKTFILPPTFGRGSEISEKPKSAEGGGQTR